MALLVAMGRFDQVDPRCVNNLYAVNQSIATNVWGNDCLCVSPISLGQCCCNCFTVAWPGITGNTSHAFGAATAQTYTANNQSPGGFAGCKSYPVNWEYQTLGSPPTMYNQFVTVCSYGDLYEQFGLSYQINPTTNARQWLMTFLFGFCDGSVTLTYKSTDPAASCAKINFTLSNVDMSAAGAGESGITWPSELTAIGKIDSTCCMPVCLQYDSSCYKSITGLKFVVSGFAYNSSAAPTDCTPCSALNGTFTLCPTWDTRGNTQCKQPLNANCMADWGCSYVSMPSLVIDGCDGLGDVAWVWTCSAPSWDCTHNGYAWVISLWALGFHGGCLDCLSPPSLLDFTTTIYTSTCAPPTSFSFVNPIRPCNPAWGTSGTGVVNVTVSAISQSPCSICESSSSSSH